jgi:oligopeptide transport system substrate-binding protein
MLALGALALLAAGCSLNPFGGGPNDLAPKSKQVFNYQLVTGATDIAGMDPDVSWGGQPDCAKADCAHAAALLPISLVYSGLVTLDADLAVENWDAQKIDISSDGLTYTFHLRDGLQFSDGKPVTAADYAYSINRTLDPCLLSPVAYYLYAIKDAITFNSERCTPGAGGAPNTYEGGYCPAGNCPVLKDLLHDSVVATDAKTLTIKLSAPFAYFLGALAYPTSYALEQSVVGGSFANSGWTNNLSVGPSGQGGSGPYYVSRWDHKGTLVLSANPHFRQQPYIQTINFTIYSDPNTAYAAYQSGKADIGYPPAAQLAQARKQSDYHEQGVLWVNHLGLNWKMAPFDDVRARQAFALALNKDTLNTSVLGGAQAPTNHIVPQGMPGYNANLKGPAGVTSTQGDPDKAKALWQQYVAAKCGGQAASCPQVTLTYSSSGPTAGKLATAMRQMWKTALGVNVTLQGVANLDTLDAQLATQSVQLWIVGWFADYPDPEDWLSLQFVPGAPYNAGNVAVPDATTHLNRADTDLNPTDRVQQYQTAEQLLVDQVAWVPLDQVEDHWQVQPWIHGYTETALGEPMLDQWLSMYVTNH